MPDKLEAGTMNVVGLGDSVQFLLDVSIAKVCEHERNLVRWFLARAGEIPALTVYGPADIKQRAGLLSFNLAG